MGIIMPKFEPLSIDERIKREAFIPRPLKHHSITDWDFQYVTWVLDGAIYHAAPPSLHGTASGAVLVKNATTGALSNGQLITWVRVDSGTALLNAFFRNQVADGGADNADCYFLRIAETECILNYYIDSSITVVETKAHTWNWVVDTWYKIRLTWWTSAERLYVRVERWTGTAWVTLGNEMDTDFEDVNDRWKDAEVNRCGFSISATRWQDDFEVWG